MKLHEASGGVAGSSITVAAAGVQILEDQWPSPPRRRAPVAPNEEQLRREPWYHSRMSRRDAEKLLIRDGDFLVRESTTNPGQYVLTGMHCGLPKHLLLVDPEGVVSLRTSENTFQKMLFPALKDHSSLSKACKGNYTYLRFFNCLFLKTS